MSHLAHHRISVRSTHPRARRAAEAAPRAEAATARESVAAPLVLAAIVVGDLLLAVTVAAVTALGA